MALLTPATALQGGGPCAVALRPPPPPPTRKPSLGCCMTALLNGKLALLTAFTVKGFRASRGGGDQALTRQKITARLTVKTAVYYSLLSRNRLSLPGLSYYHAIRKPALIAVMYDFDTAGADGLNCV